MNLKRNKFTSNTEYSKGYYSRNQNKNLTVQWNVAVQFQPQEVAGLGGVVLENAESAKACAPV